jgi:hypothetical protein
MTSERDGQPDPQVQFLVELLEENASIDGDVLKISASRWAIHGDIPVDGEILMAEFNTYEEAKYVLDQVRGKQRGTSDP